MDDLTFLYMRYVTFLYFLKFTASLYYVSTLFQILNSLHLRLKFPTVGICVKCQTVDLKIFLETTGEN